eukprot:376208_1
MLSNNFMFIDETPLNGSCYYTKPFTYYDLERDYLAELEEQKYQRHCEALQKKAYLEAMERERQQRLRRQYLLELEHRQRHLQEQEQRRQYLAHIELHRQQKLKEERLRKKKAAARAALNRREALRRGERLNHSSTSHQIIQGSDGNFYKVQLDSKYLEPMDYDNEIILSSDTHEDIGKPSLFANEKHLYRNEHSPKASFVNASAVEPSINNAPPIKDCFNTNKGGGDDMISSPNFSKKTNTKERVLSRKPPLKSSILVGDVEDASDSECEDEFSDIWHNRRPQSGRWIEPVEFRH